MATVIQIKRSTGTTAPATLKLAEQAYTYGTGSQGNGGDRLYVGTGGVDGNGDALSIDIIGGKYFTALLDHVHGTLGANSAIITDGNNAIDTLSVGNDVSSGGAIKLNEGTNNGSNFIALKSPNSVSSSTTFRLPDGDGSAGQFLKTDGSGNLDFQTVFSNIDLAGDTGTDTYNTNETLTIAGGPGMDTVVTDNNVEIQANDLTNANLSGSAGIVNANLATAGQTILGSTTLELGITETDLAGLTSLVVDDITLNGQTISTTAANKDISLQPHGTGTVIVPAGYKDRAGYQSGSLATKEYVDEVATGLDVKDSVRMGTTANLSATYSNGTAGIGATLTNSGSQAALTIDGINAAQNDRVLIKDQTNQEENGIYTVTTVGDGSSNWVLTRAIDADQNTELTGGCFTFIESGSANADNGYVFTHAGQPTLGTTDLPVSQFSGAGQIVAGAALSKIGNQMDVEVDDASIEVVSDALQVKALGIQNSMLANNTITSAKIADPLYFSDETSTQGQVALAGTLEFLAGEGINTIANGNSLTITGELASTSNIGVASFTSDNFAVNSGEVVIETIDGGTY
tara:strand:- start:1141 stop:2859 length:1719 start_codon:yes stop_codon:yes gene_type:complete